MDWGPASPVALSSPWWPPRLSAAQLTAVRGMSARESPVDFHLIVHWAGRRAELAQKHGRGYLILNASQETVLLTVVYEQILLEQTYTSQPLFSGTV